jgi:hypothetical protein
MNFRVLLPIIYTSVILVINIVYYSIFGYFVSSIGFVTTNGIFYRGAFSLLIFNSVNFFVGRYFFKNSSDNFKRYNNILFTILLIVSVIPIVLTLL